MIKVEDIGNLNSQEDPENYMVILLTLRVLDGPIMV